MGSLYSDIDAVYVPDDDNITHEFGHAVTIRNNSSDEHRH